MRQPSTGTPSVSSSSAVAGTSSSDLTPDETTSACVVASACRSADTSGGVGQPRWTPPSPPVAMKRIPAARQTASVPPTVVAPTRALHDSGGEVARPELARGRRRTAASSSSVSPTTISPSSTPIVAGTAPASRTAASEREPDLDALARREAVGDERRLERDDARRRARDLLRDADHGIAPSLCAAARGGRECRARRRRRGTRPRARRPRRSCRRPRRRPPGGRRRRRVSPRAPRFSTHRVVERPERVLLALRREDEVGRERSARARGTRRRRASTPRRRATRVRAVAARVAGRRDGGGGDRLAQQRVAGDVQHVAIEPRRLELVRGELRRGAAVGGHRAVARRGDRDDDAGPAGDRPAVLDAAPGQLAQRRARRRRRRRAGPRTSPRRRASPPTRRRSPPARPGRSLVCAGWSSPGHEGVVERARSRRAAGRRASRCAAPSTLVVWKATVAGTQVAVVRDRRARRRRRRAGDGPPLAAARLAAPRDAPGGLAAFEDAPCFLELVGEEAQRYREGGETTAGPSKPDVAVGHEMRGGGHVHDRRSASRRRVSRNHAGIRRSRNVITSGRDLVDVRRAASSTAPSRRAASATTRRQRALVSSSGPSGARRSRSRRRPAARAGTRAVRRDDA